MRGWLEPPHDLRSGVAPDSKRHVAIARCVSSGVQGLAFWRAPSQVACAAELRRSRLEEHTMSKGMEKQKKEAKKKPEKTLKEKRAEKQAKKAARS
ncbi:MAG TPA: hypothetical protein VFH71_10955 [Rhodanobacteraceae bacterium]|nr:hypothetical protein [Rhodanobacteraceae bacterium]